MQIYISRNDEQFGPYSREELTSCLEQGSLTLEDFAWHEELADWKRLGELIQVPAPPNESQRGELARQTLHVPAFEKISGRSLPAPSASPERISGRYHFAKIAILLLLIAGGGYYYLGYGGGKVAARHWIENAVGLYHRLGSRQAPVQIAQEESAPRAGEPAEATAVPKQEAPPSDLATSVQERPKKVDWAAFIASPNLWPKEVVLTAPVSFPVVLNGRVAGSIRKPSGTPVKLDGVMGSKLRIEYQGGVQTVSTKATDLEQRLLASGVTR